MWALLTSKWGLRIVGVVLILVALAGVYWYIYHKGKDAGKEEQKQESAMDINQAKELARANADKEIASAKADAAQYKEKAAAANLRAEQFASQARVYENRLVEAGNRVSATSDAKLHDLITDTLGIRQKTDMSSGYYPAEERETANRVVKYPELAGQVGSLKDQVTQLQAGQTNQQGQLDSLNRIIVAKDKQLTAYDLAYVQLWNLHPPKKRSGVCLWAWKCKALKLKSIPELEQIRAIH
jgi:hypothetical protein